MPDAVDPLGRGGDDVFLDVDTGLLAALLEDRVRQTQVGADAAVEGVVRVGDIVVSPAQLPGVGGQDEGVEARLPGAIEQGERQLVIVRHVQLEEAWAIPVGRGDLLNRRASCGGEAVGQVELSGHLSDGELGQVVVDLVDSDGCEPNGRRNLVAKYLGGCVAEVCVNKLSRDNAVPEEGLPVGKMSVRLPSIRGCIEPFGDPLSMKEV